jgi:uncharacterized membrane protein YfcA
MSAFAGGAAIGTLGGLIGLGGAEFRLPLLIGLFRFPPLEAVILNKAISLIVVTSALFFRGGVIPIGSVVAAWPVIANLLAGSLIGAWLGAGVATRLDAQTLRRTIALLLIIIAFVLMFAHSLSVHHDPGLIGMAQVIAGVLAGIFIGSIASFLGVAGGELLIPTIILLFGVDVKLAGSVSLAVSLPTMLTGFARYSRDQSFTVLSSNRKFVGTMAAGSIVGALLGGMMLGFVPDGALLPLLALILIVSAVKT